MRANKWQLFIVFCTINLLIAGALFAGTTSKLSNIFTLDTREVNPIPVDGWQILSNQGDTYNEDFVIDNFGKVWCFYYNSPGDNQPVYMRIFRPSGYQYKIKTVIGHGSYLSSEYNSIRAALNDSTGDVWVAIQGNEGSYFMIFDSTGTVKQDSTLLNYNAYMAKVTCDKNNKMWFSWHTDVTYPEESTAKIACYQPNGEPFYTAQNVSGRTGILNTDIAVDDSNHVWVLWQATNGSDYSTRFSVFKNNLDNIIDANVITDNEVAMSSERQIYADPINHRMWILEKNLPIVNQQLHLYQLDGTRIKTIYDTGDCAFTRNQDNQLEVVRFNDSEILNKKYEVAYFDTQDGDTLEIWSTLFDSTSQFVKNAITYNNNYKSLKLYAVNDDQNLTKIKFQEVTPAYPEISVKPTSINFDTTKIQENYQKQRLITIQNNGSDILTVSNIESNDAHFTVSQTSLELLPNESQNVVIYFSPTDTNQVNSTVLVYSNDPSNYAVEVVVSGKGYNPSTPKITVVPGSIIFDTNVIGSSQTKYTYVNNGDEYEPLVVSSITSSNPQFTVSDTTFTVTPQSGKFIGITFTPVETGFIEGSLTINSNDPDSSSYIVPLVGEGREPDQPQISVGTDSLYFGEVTIDEQRTLSIEVTNLGEATLTVSSVSSNNAQFTANREQFNVGASETEILQITFSPTEEGFTDGVITLISNDANNPETFVKVAGIGLLLTDPKIIYGQTQINFGPVFVGDTLRRGIIFQNFGDRTLELFDITASDTHFFVEEDFIEIEKQESHTLMVSFAPDDTVNYQAVLQIYTNDPDSELVQIGLSGSGEKNYQRISVFPSKLNYEDVLVNSSSTKSLLVTNMSNTSPLTISNIFSRDDNFYAHDDGFTLSREQSRQVLVTFTPDSIGQFNGTITFVSDDPVVDTLDVTVSGTGRDSTRAHIMISADNLEFGTVAKNNTKPLALTISNRGEKPLLIKVLTEQNPDSVFSVTNPNLYIEGLSSQNVYVYFTPDAVADFESLLRIVHNDVEQDTLDVKLTGKGRAPYPQQIELSTRELDFGTVPIGRSAARSFYIQNIGEQRLTVSQISVTKAQFHLSHLWFTLNPNETKYLSVTFTPVETGTFSDTITIVSNDPENPEVSVYLNANAEEYRGPNASIYPSQIYFGNTILGARKQQAFWISNSSSQSNLNVTDYFINNPNYSVSFQNLQIPPEGSAAIQVTYHPTTTGYQSGSLALYTNDLYNEQLNGWMYGYGFSEENVGQNLLGNLNWYADASAPFGDAYGEMDHTPNVLTNEEDRAWFIKDIYLYEYPGPDSTIINISFKNNITLVINNTFVLESSSTELLYWNVENFDIYNYLNIGRNRIAAYVRTNNNDPVGGFDCELFVNGETKIKRGDQNWNQPEALWWYYYQPGSNVPWDNLQGRLWFDKDYAYIGIDSVTANWDFEPNGSDTLYDNSPYGHRAILHNVSWINGVKGQAMRFTGGENSYTELGANLNSLPLSIEIWANSYGTQTGVQNLVSNFGNGKYGRGLFINEVKKLGVYYYSDTNENQFIIEDFTVEDSVWYKMSVQYDMNPVTGLSYIYVYVNNELVGTKEYDFPGVYPTGSINKCYLSANQMAPDGFGFAGAIDELKIKNTVTGQAPPPDEVAELSFFKPDSLIKGEEDIQFEFDIFPTPFEIISGEFKYSAGGSNSAVTMAIGQSDSIYNSPLIITLPSEAIDIRGLNFSLTAETNYGTVHYPVFGPGEFGYEFVRVYSNQEQSNLALTERSYRMISVPYELQNNSIDAVLGDEFGSYNKYKWRVFDWLETDTSDFYIEYQEPFWDNDKGFERGKAFWLITNRDISFDAGSGITPENEDFILELNDGWNMIANPFPYPVYWSEVVKSDEDLVSEPIFYNSEEDTAFYSYLTEIIEPWMGYFVWNEDTTAIKQFLVFPAQSESEYGPLKKALSPIEKYLTKYQDLELLISSSVRCGKYADNFNLFGAAKNANNGFDKYDAMEVPQIGEYVSLWSLKEERKRAYTADIRKSGKDGYSWKVMIDYLIENPQKVITAMFKSIIELPEDWELYLFDLSQDIAYDLKKNNEIKIQAKAGERTIKPYKLVIGTEEFIQNNSDDIPLVPMEFKLHQNYPNPFNASTTVQFSLPKRMRAEVNIYNILGQKVKTLVDGELRGGMHKMIWDGTNDHGHLLSTGIYFVRITGQNKTAVKKALLIK